MFFVIIIFILESQFVKISLHLIASNSSSIFNNFTILQYFSNTFYNFYWGI